MAWLIVLSAASCTKADSTADLAEALGDTIVPSHLIEIMPYAAWVLYAFSVTPPSHQVHCIVLGASDQLLFDSEVGPSKRNWEHVTSACLAAM